MTQQSSEAVVSATGKTWEEWFAILDAAGARDLPHNAIAYWLYEQGHLSAGWWCQSVTVAYERHIGRRVIGQSVTGDFRTQSTRTMTGTPDGVFAAWLERVRDVWSFDGVAVLDEPKISITENWRYWRVTLENGGKVDFRLNAKSSEAVSVSVVHAKLPDKPTADRWKAFWKAYLLEL